MADITEDRLAKLVLERWDQGSEHVENERRQYWLNLAFYQGQQWIYWDRARRQPSRIEDVVGGDTNRIRETINLIQPRTDRLVGQLTQRNLAFEVPPTSADDASTQGARKAEWVLTSEHDDRDWNEIRVAELYDALFGGVSAVSVEWVEGAKPWTSQNHGYSVENDDQSESRGVVDLREWAIPEFAIEPGARKSRTARWWCSCVALAPEFVRDYYNLSYTPKTDGTKTYSPLQRQMLSDRGISPGAELTQVFTYYERPNDKCEKGRYVVVIGGKAVISRDWPFPFDELNIETFVAKPLPGTWCGVTPLTSARSPQTAYNHLSSIILEHAKRAGNARLLIPSGSIADPTIMTDTPGEGIEYFPDQSGQGPHWMPAPEMSRYVFLQKDTIIREIDEIMHSNEVARGVAPGDRNSGLALSILAERNDTPLGVMAHNQASGWAGIATKVLKLFEKRAGDTRESVVMLDGGVPYSFSWNGAELQGQTRVTVPLESTTPQSRSALAAQYMEMATAFPQITEGVPRHQLLTVFNMPGRRSLEESVDPDAAKAQRENSLLVAGEVPIPARFDDHAVHMSVHNNFRKSRTYEFMPDELRQSVDDHIDAHQRLVEEEAVQQAQLNDAVPGLGALPQADEPVGSAVPMSPYEPQMQGEA